MKRTVGSILTAALATLLPGLSGPPGEVAAAVPEAVHPAPEAVEARKADVRDDERRADDLDRDPAPSPPVPFAGAFAATPPGAVVAPRPASAGPDVVPLARRALGPPRARAPDRTV